jgi:hypothetical protein
MPEVEATMLDDGRVLEVGPLGHTSLTIDAEATCVAVGNLDPGLMAALSSYLKVGGSPESLLRVTVVQTGALSAEELPQILGRYCLAEDRFQFTPHFPFERGISYRVRFDSRPLGRAEFSGALTHEFSFPKERGTPAEITHIFPSSDLLPENLLRLHVCFSEPMQRGQAEAEISILGPDGTSAPDVLYRAPVELWDRSMRNLTILLDPGRLKRGVGPNRELGPPLKVGQLYTLVVGAGMTGQSGERLREPVCKRFRVTEAVRELVAVEKWKIRAPKANTREPLMLTFPRPLDWGLVLHALTVTSASNQPVMADISIDQCETRWSFTPASPWSIGVYDIHVAPTLEDVCGNSVIAAFDRPLRSGSDLAYEVAGRSISFDVV